MCNRREFCSNSLIVDYHMRTIDSESNQILQSVRINFGEQECVAQSQQERAEVIVKAYLDGFFLNVAYWYGEHASKKQYRSLRTHRRLKRNSKWTWERDPNPMLVVFREVVETYHTMMEHCMRIEAPWLLECLSRPPIRMKFITRESTRSNLGLSERNC